jgi:hypothetical protein
MGLMERKSIPLIVIIALLCLSSWASNWFEVSGEGTYTEGMEREPTIKFDYIIDNSHEKISISIENATPLLSYWSQRADVSADPEINNGSTSPDIQSTSNSEKYQGLCLDFLRGIIPIFYILFLLFVIYYEINQSRRLKFAIFFSWSITILILLVAVPFAFANDFGIYSDSESSTGGFDSDTKDAVASNQFAHFIDDSNFGISFDGIYFEYQSSGFDLGLLDEADRQSVIDNKPQEGDKGHESLIEFEGIVNIGPGNSIFWLFFAGLILFINSPQTPKSDEEE